ncbi:MAG: NAD-glutamate dehydrogenase [Antricoccus sp.]
MAGAFGRAYLDQLPPEDFFGHSTESLTAVIGANFLGGRVRAEGAITVVGRRTSSNRAAIDIIVDDRPFLVDSVTAALMRARVTLRWLTHPVLHIVRGANGEFSEIATTASERKRTPGEAWMYVEVAAIESDEQLDALIVTLSQVLRDVADSGDDWAMMRDRAVDIAAELRADTPTGIGKDETAESAELLEWLTDNHFTFLGYREYKLTRSRAKDYLDFVPGTGLGILRQHSTTKKHVPLPPMSQARAREKRLLILTKASSRSTVHRSAYLDYISIRQFDAKGEVIGEKRFLGLLTSSAYRQRVESVPVIKHKMRRVMEASEFDPLSHSGKDLRDAIETFPRDELFQAKVEHILPVALAVMTIGQRRQTRLFLRRDDFGRFYSALIYLPRDRFNTQVRERIEGILVSELMGTSFEYSSQSGDSSSIRLEFVVRVPAGAADEDLSPTRVAAIERRLVKAACSWDDELHQELAQTLIEDSDDIELIARSLPGSYRSDFTPIAAITDIEAFRQILAYDLDVDPVDQPMVAAGISMHLYLQPGDDGIVVDSSADLHSDASIRLKVYSLKQSLQLSDVMPILQGLGLRVLDVRTYDFDLPELFESKPAWIYDFGLKPIVTLAKKRTGLAEKFSQAFAAAWSGTSETDSLNSLVLSTGMEWRQISLLRAIARYLRVGALPYSKELVDLAIVSNPNTAQLLVDLFTNLFDPSSGDNRHQRDRHAERIRTNIREALVDVASLDEDRTLSAMYRVIRATLRTNFYQRSEEGHLRPYISFKLDPPAIPELPDPKPYREIWVYSPRFEGIHLRFGPVARGGLRWSDRRDDMRTEVLGLVKAQIVKNTVIVPTGAKGGFLPKRLPDADVDRQGWLDEGIACYKSFIRALLQITDNRIDGLIVPPPQVIRRDDDDSYLVVAADKGTATFSDFANAESVNSGYWLGDAFASGGSVGYDHKAMGITARGAWESVKRHFRDLHIDCQTQPFTAVGIGDMSGDVFGNGMLLSEQIRLVAAFDHRHIFIDPNPDPAVGFAERRRLFALDRSSWDNYNRDLISRGGGIWSRQAKSIKLTIGMRECLGIDSKAAEMSPAELMRAILLAPVDLFWNGGIGTYIKASGESDAQVGDRANDSIRVNGADLRCRVVGEGGNLGVTQNGRIEYALTGAGGEGGKINTDAIDNSAGVDTSDHEVNIKILLQQAIADGALKPSARARLLGSMTDEIADHVLQNNYDQNAALASEERNSLSLNDAHRRLMHRLEAFKLLDRAIEKLPSDAQIRDRYRQGRGLTSPELCVMLAYSKILMKVQILESDIPEDNAYHDLLISYFPTALRKKYASQMDNHPLRREIIATLLSNRIVNTAGTTGVLRMIEETGMTPVAVLRAQSAASQIFDMPGMFAKVASLDNQVSSAAQTSMRIEGQRLVERATRWLVRSIAAPIDVAATVAQYAEGVTEVVEVLPRALRGLDQKAFEFRCAELQEAGVPQATAMQVATMTKAIAAMDIVDLTKSTSAKVSDIVMTHMFVAERFDISALLERIIAMPRDSRWRAMARGTLRDDLNGSHAVLTAQVLHTGSSGSRPETRSDQWTAQLSEAAGQSLVMLDEIISSETSDLAAVVVAVQLIRDLVSGTTTTH